MRDPSSEILRIKKVGQLMKMLDLSLRTRHMMLLTKNTK
jgi:hypothetical protein